MKNATRTLTISILLLCLTALFIPSVAQEEAQRGGGTLLFPQHSATTEFNGSNYYCNDAYCSRSVGLMQTALIGVDPTTGWYAPNLHGALAESWEFSENNRVMTLHLRDDFSWTDGTAISSADVMMSYELGLNPESNNDGEQGVIELKSIFESVEAPDDYTLIIRFNQGNCDGIANIGDLLRVIPAHVYRQLISEVGYADLRNHEWFKHPDVTSGPFIFGEILDDHSIVLLRNEGYTDNALGYVAAERFIQVHHFYESSEDAQRQTREAWFSGGIHTTSVAPADYEEARELANAGELQLYEGPSLSWHFMAMNSADPTNPQPALDNNGNRIEQGLHPIFGDKLTRQAIAHAIDIDTMIEQVLLGFATRIPAHVPPASWGYNHNLQPIPYNPELALSMLAESGWLPENPILPASETNKLICHDCLYAREIDADFNGTYLNFEILVQEDTVWDYDHQEALFVQSYLSQIGVDVEIRLLDFSTLLEHTLNQTYDAAMLGLNNGYPSNPAPSVFYVPQSDTPSSGLNFTSFYNEAYFALDETALTVPGCGLTERVNIYHRMQEIMQDEIPFIFLYSTNNMYIAQNEIEGFAPYPINPYWNLDTWWVREGD